MRKLIILFFLFLSISSFAQLPETVVYLFQITRTGKSYKLQSPKIISKTTGYNNQPYFTPDGKYVYYVSSIDTVNTEIYRYDIEKKKSKRITRTKQVPEYSPKYTPDMERISCVRVEEDNTTQHLYTYNLKGKKPVVHMPIVTSVGYYEWISQDEILTFELPEPFYFVKRNLALKTADTLCQNIGRTFYSLRSKGKVVYVDKTDSLNWKIRTVAKENLKRIKTGPKLENPILSDCLPGEEDYCFMQDGSILMGHDGMIYMKKNPFRYTDSTWDEWNDLKPFGINKFYRIVISPDNTQLALVVYKGKKP
jgi:hypothetical protein